MKRNEMIPQVILIGGSSSVGKTTVSETLSNALDLRHLRLKDLSTAKDDLELYLLTGEPSQWDWPMEDLVNMILRRGVALANHLAPAIQNWINSESRVLLGIRSMIECLRQLKLPNQTIQPIRLRLSADCRRYNLLIWKGEYYEMSHM